MKKNNFCIGTASAITILLLSSANAFEPVSIDDFFKKYPNERSIQPTIQNNQSKNSNYKSRPHQNTKIEFIERETPITAQKYQKVTVLLLDRISGGSKVTEFAMGETKKLASFDVTISECIERKTEFEYTTHGVHMTIVGFENSKASTQEKTLYDDIFYIESPGFRGFEHSDYDIKPTACLGTPETITLDEPVVTPDLDNPIALENSGVQTPDTQAQKSDVPNAMPLPEEKKYEKKDEKKDDKTSEKAIENIINDDTKTLKLPQDKSDFVPVKVPLEPIEIE
jgi:hypothetical protein